MRFLFAASLLISMAWMTSCQHGGAMITDTPMGMPDIRKAVVSIIGEPRHVTDNGAEIESVYYDRKEKPIERPKEARERLYTRVGILGDRRPYDLRIEVLVEVRGPQGYELVGEDDRRAQAVATRIRKALHEGRDKRNLLDDFQAF